MRIVALLTIRNEALYLDRCLQHLYEQGVEVCIVDNGSTDASLSIAELWRGKGVFQIEHLHYPGYFDLQGILANEQRLAEEIDADWFLHYDADEIRESPIAGETLLEAIKRVDREGFDAINFDEFVFMPCHDDASFEGKDYVKEMRYYYFFEPHPIRQVKGWKKGISLDLVHAGGHRISKEALNIAPDHFVMRHYIALSADYAIEKYTKKRIYSSDEVENRGWHGRRARFSAQDLVLPDRQQLKCIDEPWDRSDPWSIHAFLGHHLPPAPFVVGVGRSGTTLLRLMLDAHPDLAIPSETHFLPNLFKLADQVEPFTADQALQKITEIHTWSDFNVSREALRERLLSLDSLTVVEVARSMYALYLEGIGKKRWGDKTPLYQLHMEMISKHLPEARFVHIIRDGRDVALSMRQLWFGPGNDLRDQAKKWCDHIQECRRQAKRIPYYMEIHYEDLVRTPEKVLREICAFIQLPFDEKMLDYYLSAEQRLSEIGHRYAKDGSVMIDAQQRRSIHDKTMMKPDTSRIECWRGEMSIDEQRAYRSVAGALLEELGYAL